jgi:hypothetical protein
MEQEEVGEVIQSAPRRFRASSATHPNVSAVTTDSRNSRVANSLFSSTYLTTDEVAGADETVAAHGSFPLERDDMADMIENAQTFGRFRHDVRASSNIWHTKYDPIILPRRL